MSAGLKAAVERVSLIKRATIMANVLERDYAVPNAVALIRELRVALSSQAEVMEAMAGALDEAMRALVTSIPGGVLHGPEARAAIRTALSQYHSLTGEKA
jgi:hypothetical protein